jgi:hypothetical protein
MRRWKVTWNNDVAGLSLLTTKWKWCSPWRTFFHEQVIQHSLCVIARKKRLSDGRFSLDIAQRSITALYLERRPGDS